MCVLHLVDDSVYGEVIAHRRPPAGPPPEASRRGVGRPVAADSDRTRLGILDAAIDAFADRGYAGASLRSIAKRAGITQGTLFHYYRSKRWLFADAYSHALDVVYDGYAASIEGCASLRAELDAVLTHTQRVMTSRPAITKLVARAWTDFDHPELQPLPAPVAFQALMAGMTQRAVERGELALSDARRFDVLFASVMWGISMMGMDNESALRTSIEGFRRLFDGTLLRR